MFGVVTMHGAESCHGQSPSPPAGSVAYNASHCGPWSGKVRTLPQAPFVLFSDLGGLSCADAAAPKFAVARNAKADCLASKVWAYQHLRGLTADGKLGPGTLRALRRDAGILERERQASDRKQPPGVVGGALPPGLEAAAMASPTLTQPGSTLMASMMNVKGLLIVGGGLLVAVGLVRYAGSRR